MTHIDGGGGRNNVILSISGAENVTSAERNVDRVARTSACTSPPAVSVPPYRCHCPDWYEGEDCDHDD